MIPISKAIAGPISTTSGTITDMTGVSTTVTLTQTAHIMAFMSLILTITWF